MSGGETYTGAPSSGEARGGGVTIRQGGSAPALGRPEGVEPVHPDETRGDHLNDLDLLATACSCASLAIPQRFEATEVKAMLAERDKRIEELTTELDRLRKVRRTGP